MIALSEAIRLLDDAKRVSIPNDCPVSDADRIAGFRIRQDDFMHLSAPLDALSVVIEAAKRYYQEYGDAD